MKSKKIIDIATIIMLVCAFGLAYYTGLAGKKANGEMLLDVKTFALIAICGSVVLLAVGGASELISRVRRNCVTWSFTAFMAVQVAALVGMCAIAVALLSGAFSPESTGIRAMFIVFAAVEILGYVQSVIYAGGVEKLDEAEDDDYGEEDQTAEETAADAE